MRKRDITRTLFHPPTRFPRFCQPPPSIRLHLAAFGDETEPTPRITELSSRASRPRDATHFPLRSCVTLSWRRGLWPMQPMRSRTVDSFFFLFIDAELISLLFLFSFLPRQKVPFSRYGIRITFDRLRHGRQVERHQNRERRLTNVPRVIDSGN